MAINPYVVIFSSQLLTDLLFLALILSAMLLVERGVDGESGTALAIAAGVVAGLAYLTRSAGIALLPAAIVYLALRGKWRKGLWFAAAMAPFIAGWMLWARLHQAHTSDSVLMNYTDYLGYEIYTLRHVSLRMLVWKDIDAFIWALGSLIQPKVANSQVLKILASAMGVAMISGIVRIVRRGHALLYALFAAGSVLLFVVFTIADERHALSLFPLALAGLLVEMEHLARMVRAGVRHRDRSQRIVAGALAAAAVVVLAGSVALQVYVTFVALPQVTREQRLAKANRVAAYRWISMNVPADANLLTPGGDGPLLFLYTGRHAIANRLPVVFWYQDEHARMVDWMGNPVPFARAHGLKYFEFAGVHTSWDGLSEEDGAAAERAILENPDFTALYRNGPVTVYALPQ
jgi:4-amino-4-deoxy-L-arabinose transferase-like glycosyltransferase